MKPTIGASGESRGRSEWSCWPGEPARSVLPKSELSLNGAPMTHRQATRTGKCRYTSSNAGPRLTTSFRRVVVLVILKSGPVSDCMMVSYAAARLCICFARNGPGITTKPSSRSSRADAAGKVAQEAISSKYGSFTYSALQGRPCSMENPFSSFIFLIVGGANVLPGTISFDQRIFWRSRNTPAGLGRRRRWQ